MLYEFRKLYADLAAEDGTFLVLYLNRIKLGGWQLRGSVEVYLPDGRHETLQGRPEDLALDLAAPLPGAPLRLALDGGGTFELKPEVVHGEWVPAVPCPVAPLQWRVKAARARMVARWSGAGAGGERVLRGQGYVDLVRITRATRMLGLRTLHWGRAHLSGGRTVIFEDLTLADGRRWTVVLDEPGGDVADSAGAVALEPGGEGTVWLRAGELMKLAPSRVLHEGNAFGADRIPGRLDRALCEAVGGPTWQVRWFGEASCGALKGPAVWERVQFGGQ